MALSESQKVDFLLKKIGYTASKTGLSAEESSLTGTKKAGFAEAIPSPLKIADSSIWAESEHVPGTPPTSSSSYVGVSTGANAVHMTVDSTVASNRSFVARSTWNDPTSANTQNWIDTQYGTDYLIKVWMGNPTGVSTALSAGGSGNNDEWFFDYASGVLNFNGTNVPTGISTSNIYVEGYRYVGATGVPSPSDPLEITNLYVSGISTFVGIATFRGGIIVHAGVSTFAANIDANGGITANTLKVEDLTDNRIVIAGTGGELEDSANLTFNGSTLAVTGNQTVSGTIDVDGQAIFDDITVSAASTFTGISTFNSNIFVEATTDTNQLNVSGISTFNVVNVVGVSTFSDTVNLPDDVKAIFGTGQDLQISHTNDISLIRDTRAGVGGTLAVGADHLILRNKDGNEKYFEAFDNGKVSLFYDSLPKLETSGIGVTVYTQLDTTNLKVSGVSTFTGNIDANGNLDVDGTTELDGLNVDGATTLDATTTDGLLDINAGGQANTFKVEDLTSGRVVLAGTGGELEDSGNLTFNGSTLAVTGSQTVSGDISVVGNVSIGGTLTYEDVTNVDSVGLATARIGLRVLNGGIVVNAGVSTFTALVDINGGGQANTFKVEDLTAGRVVLAGTGGEIEDSNKLTFDGSKLEIVGHVETDTLQVAGVSTFAGALDANAGAHITGVSTIANLKVGSITATAILDEDGMASNSDTSLATQQSIKAYVDNSSPGGSNLIVSADSGSNETINLSSEVLDIEGTSNEIETVTGTNKVVIGLPNDVTITGDLTVGVGLTVVGVSTFAGNIDANANLDVDGQTDLDVLNVSDTATFAAGLVANGNVDLGNATSDTITATGRFDSDLVPSADSAKDLGTSALNWRKIYVDEIDLPGGPVGEDIVTRNLKATGISTFQGDTTIGVGGTTLTGITTNSRVGINSTAPAYTLDVGGIINSSTDVRINGVSVGGAASLDDVTALAIALG